MAILIDNQSDKVCGEQPCWLPEGVGTNGRCIYTGCLLPYMWQCRRSKAECTSTFRRQGIKVYAVSPQGKHRAFDTIKDMADFFDVPYATLQKQRQKGEIIKKGPMAGYRVV